MLSKGQLSDKDSVGHHRIGYAFSVRSGGTEQPA